MANSHHYSRENMKINILGRAKNIKSFQVVKNILEVKKENHKNSTTLLYVLSVTEKS